jgi:hypothetical protein
MATKEQIAANRRNAKKSTGPTSPAGKAVASMNNLRHGLRARTIILPGETQEEFDEILAGLQQEYQPQSSSEHYFVKEAAVAQWMLGRAAAYEASCCEENPDLSACCALFSRMTLVTGRLQRIYLKFYKELERIKAVRAAARDKQPEQPNEPSTEKSSTEKSDKEKSDKEKKEMDDMGGPTSTCSSWIPIPACGTTSTAGAMAKASCRPRPANVGRTPPVAPLRPATDAPTITNLYPKSAYAHRPQAQFRFCMS